MTSKISLNKFLPELGNTYLWATKKNLGMMALLATLQFLAFPLIVWFSLANTEMISWIPAGEQYANVFSRVSYYSTTFLVTPLCLLFVLLTAVSLFQYMHNKRSVDLFHALPVGRSAMLLGRFLAGLTTLFAPMLLNFSVVAVIGLAYGIENSGKHIGYLYSVLLWLFLMLTAALLFCVLMAVCSGTTLDMVLSVIGVNIAYPLLILAVLFVMSCLLPGFNTDQVPPLLATLISPFTAIFAAVMSVDQAFDAGKITFLIWWIVFSVFLALLCVYLYRRRKSESAENTFAFAIPKQIIRFLLTAVGGLGLGLIFYWYNSTTLNFI
ncbi:ABC transporter permease, partial [Blautia wexlerae]|nr:ABC transporter permease [Blautia wexlerae]